MTRQQYITDMPEPGAGLRPAKPWRRVTATAAAVALATAGCATGAMARPYNPDNLGSDQLAHIGAICETVMRVHPNEAHYDGCVMSLSDSAHNQGGGLALLQAHDDCRQKGLQPNTPELATCVLQSEEAGSAQPSALRIGSPSNLQMPGGSKSYSFVSSRDRFRREQLSCALLGLDPVHDAFAGCVANLASTLFGLDNPQN
jgi:hypothetical protein